MVLLRQTAREINHKEKREINRRKRMRDHLRDAGGRNTYQISGLR